MTAAKDVSAEQAFSLGGLTLATQRLTEARAVTAEAEQEWREMIRRAVQARWRVATIAEAAGISRERVYQIRDGRY